MRHSLLALLCAVPLVSSQLPWQEQVEDIPLCHIYQPSSRCRSLKGVMVLQDCAKGPYGKSQLLRQEMEAVFGVYMCYSLFYGYLTVQDLDEYDVIYIDGSGEDFSTVSDWLSSGQIENGGATFLEEFVKRGKTIFFNAALSEQAEPISWSLPFGASLNWEGNQDRSVAGQGGIVGGSYLTQTNVFRGIPSFLSNEPVVHEKGYFAEGYIGSLGAKYLPLIISKETGHPVLVGGVMLTASNRLPNVFLGTMTTSDLHWPKPDATHLRLNMLELLCGGLHPCDRACSYPIDNKNCYHCYSNMTSVSK